MGMFDDMEKDVFELEDEKVEKETKKKSRKSKKEKEEFDSAFDGEEKMMSKLSSMKSELKIIQKEIDIDDIITSNFKKISREDSVSGLTGVVSTWGVVTPIHVLALEDEDCYQLLDGLRRIFAALRSGKKKIQAIIWDFSDKREGKEMANIICLMINRTQRFTSKEKWEQMKILESVNDATPGLIEYLLQMESGDAMKLKDIMLADDSYKDFKDGLLNGKYTIDQAYKKLCNERKKEDKLEKEDKMSVDSDGIVDAKSSTISNGDNEDEEEKEVLSAKEAKEVLEMYDNNTSEEDSIEDLNKTDEIRKDSMHQKVGERTFVDESVKKAVLIRDGNRCQCCGKGGEAWAGILVYHHKVPVYAGGPDTVDNGITLCVNCHLTLHNYITGDVQIPKDLDPEEEKIFKNIMRIGNIAIEAGNKLGMKRDELKKANAKSKKHPMPNANVRINKEALAESQVLDEQNGNIENLEKDEIIEDNELGNEEVLPEDFIFDDVEE